MEKVYVAVGTTRRPKLNAVWEGLSVFGPTLDPSVQFEVAGVNVESGVSHTPISRDESMRGARQRAEGLVKIAREQNQPWRYFVGLEGGLDVIGEHAVRRAFLESWAYVTDGEGTGARAESKFPQRWLRKCSIAEWSSRLRSTGLRAGKASATHRERGGFFRAI